MWTTCSCKLTPCNQTSKHLIVHCSFHYFFFRLSQVFVLNYTNESPLLPVASWDHPWLSHVTCRPVLLGSEYILLSPCPIHAHVFGMRMDRWALGYCIHTRHQHGYLNKNETQKPSLKTKNYTLYTHAPPHTKCDLVHQNEPVGSEVQN